MLVFVQVAPSVVLPNSTAKIVPESSDSLLVKLEVPAPAEINTFAVEELKVPPVKIIVLEPAPIHEKQLELVWQSE